MSKVLSKIDEFYSIKPKLDMGLFVDLAESPQVRLKMNDKKPSKFQFYFSGVLEAFSMLKK